MIVSRSDSVADLRHPPARVEAVGSAIHGRPSWDQWDDLTTMALRDAAAMLWRRITPVSIIRSRIDLAHILSQYSWDL